MRSLLFTIIISALLCTPAQSADYKKEALAKKDAYFKHPQNTAMIIIEASQKLPWESPITVTQSISGFEDNASHTFETGTPYVLIVPMDAVIKEIKASYDKVKDADKQQFLLQIDMLSPFISVIAQSKDARGIKGSIYYDGKEVSSDNADIEYGAISLSYRVPLLKNIRNDKPPAL